MTEHAPPNALEVERLVELLVATFDAEDVTDDALDDVLDDNVALDRVRGWNAAVYAAAETDPSYVQARAVLRSRRLAL